MIIRFELWCAEMECELQERGVTHREGDGQLLRWFDWGWTPEEAANVTEECGRRAREVMKSLWNQDND